MNETSPHTNTHKKRERFLFGIKCFFCIKRHSKKNRVLKKTKLIQIVFEKIKLILIVIEKIALIQIVFEINKN
jgi:hypothetical protein